MDYYRNKHILGELTFGEYWNLAGCNAACVKFQGEKELCHRFQPKEEHIRFLWENLYISSGEEFSIRIPLCSKAKVIGNKVITRNDIGKEVTLEFYDLTPTKYPL